MKRLGLLLCLGVSCSSVAQTTWQGLQFGMDRQRVRDALVKSGFSVQPEPEAQMSVVTPDFELPTNSSYLSANLKSEIASAPVFFIPSLSFGPQDKLIVVKLTLDPSKTFQTTPALGSNLPMLTFLAGTSAYEQLVSKYGPPDSTRGPCDNIPIAELVGSHTECTAQWSGSGQSVELYWYYNWTPSILKFTITYSGLTSGL